MADRNSHAVRAGRVEEEDLGELVTCLHYVADLENMIDIEAIRKSGVIGADPIGGASVDYYELQSPERYGIDLTVVNHRG